MKESTKITIIKDGPIMVQGPVNSVGPVMAEETFKIIKSNGEEVDMEKCFLCRCGGSNNKPFCDGTHKKIDFKD